MHTITRTSVLTISLCILYILYIHFKDENFTVCELTGKEIIRQHSDLSYLRKSYSGHCKYFPLKRLDLE